MIWIESEKMAEDFHSARYWAKEKMMTALYPGAVCVDATMGRRGRRWGLCAPRPRT